MDANIEKLKEFWYSRNPSHETNSDTSEDMYWQTVYCVFKDLNQSLTIQLSEANETIASLRGDKDVLWKENDLLNKTVGRLAKEKREKEEELMGLTNKIEELEAEFRRIDLKHKLEIKGLNNSNKFLDECRKEWFDKYLKIEKEMQESLYLYERQNNTIIDLQEKLAKAKIIGI